MVKKKNKVLWFTGLYGSGKTTIATQLFDKLSKDNISAVLLDGGIVRRGLCDV